MIKSSRESIFEICRTRTHKKADAGLKDLTERVLKDLCPPIDVDAFPHGRVDLRTVSIFGQPDSGKTTTAEAIAYQFWKAYGEEANIVGIRGSRFRDLAAKMDSRRVQVLVVDDAKAMSRGGYKNIEDMNEIDDVRHRFGDLREAAGQPRDGDIVAIHIKQRYKDLDIKFRQAHFRIFKSTTGPDDKWDLIAQVGPEGYTYLEKITRRMNELRDQTAKGEMIVVLDWLRNSGRFIPPMFEQKVISWQRIEETGEIHRTMDLDPAAISEDAGAFVVDVQPILKMISDEGGEWPLKVRVFETYQGAASQSKVAEQFGVSQGSVSNYAAEVKGMISKTIGEAYEIWAAEKWSKEPGVIKVERFGGLHEPDILAHHDNGRITVVSCKCYYDNKTTSIPIKQIEPELLKAQELAAAGLLNKLVVDFNNIAKKARVLRAVDPELHDSVVTFR